MAGWRADCLAFLVGISFVLPLRADLRIRVRETRPGSASTIVHYYKDHLWRSGPIGEASYTIVDWAGRHTITVDPATHEYSVFEPPPQGQPAPTDSSVTLVMQIETRETGEQRPMFGHTARHFITTQRRHTEYVDRPASATEEIVTDGWYLDIAGPSPALTGAGTVAFFAVDAHARPQFKVTRNGPAPHGLAVWEKTGDYLREVTEFSEAPLDPKLFEIPNGYRQVDHPSLREPLSWSDLLDAYWREFQNWLSRVL